MRCSRICPYSLLFVIHYQHSYSETLWIRGPVWRQAAIPDSCLSIGEWIGYKTFASRGSL